MRRTKWIHTANGEYNWYSVTVCSFWVMDLWFIALTTEILHPVINSLTSTSTIATTTTTLTTTTTSNMLARFRYTENFPKWCIQKTTFSFLFLPFHFSANHFRSIDVIDIKISRTPGTYNDVHGQNRSASCRIPSKVSFVYLCDGKCVTQKMCKIYLYIFYIPYVNHNMQ